MRIVDYQNIHQLLKKTVETKPDTTAYRWFLDSEGTSESVTWSEFYDQIKQVGKGLMALGVEKNDKVIILSYTCYKWVLTDMGTTCSGAVTVGIYQSNLPEDCKYIINHSDSVVVFAENQDQLDKILKIKDEIPNIRKVILFKGETRDDWIISYDDFLALGKNVTEKDYQKRVKEITPPDVATIVYTSGTTGVPKGAVITQDNVMEYANENGIQYDKFEDLLENDKLQKMIENEVAEKNKKFAKFETIKKVALVPEFTVENKMMTPTFKVKKNVAFEAYKDKIDAMYPKD